MSNKKITQLPPSATPLTGAEILPVVQSSATVQTSVNSLGPGIGYTPAGTGAVSRTVQAKLRESVSVLDFGADPTGVADSTAAIQAALNAGFKAVYVPAGSYKFSTLTLPTTFGFVFFGSGTSSVLVQTGAGIKWPSTGTAANGYYEGYIRDLSFTGTAGTGNTIDTQYAVGVTLQDLYFGNIPVGYNSIAVNGNPTATGDKYSHDVRLRNIQVYTFELNQTLSNNRRFTSGLLMKRDFVLRCWP